MQLDLSNYDFVDFGCSRGGSIKAAMKLFPNTRGLGIDISPKKVAAAQAAGFNAVEANALDLTAHPDQVRFCILSHFLEHLPGSREAFACLHSACVTAREFVYIQQPWFDADGYLLARGLKFNWSDWKVHSYHMTSLEMLQCLRALREEGIIREFAIYGSFPVANSDDPRMHPLDTPRDENPYDAAKHPPKPSISFSIDVFRELRAVAAIDADIDAIANRFGVHRLLYKS